MWSSDHFGWPITARPFAATSTRQFVEVSEVMNQMVRRACDFSQAEVKNPMAASTTTTTTTTTTTPNLSFANGRPRSVKEKDDVLKEPVQAASYPDLVSLISNFFLKDHKITQLLCSSKMKRLNARVAISQIEYPVKNILQFKLKIKLRYC